MNEIDGLTTPPPHSINAHISAFHDSVSQTNETFKKTHYAQQSWN